MQEIALVVAGILERFEFGEKLLTGGGLREARSLGLGTVFGLRALAQPRDFLEDLGGNLRRRRRLRRRRLRVGRAPMPSASATRAGSML